MLEFVAGGQICQRKLLSAVSDSSQQLKVPKEVASCQSYCLRLELVPHGVKGEAQDMSTC